MKPLFCAGRFLAVAAVAALLASGPIAARAGIDDLPRRSLDRPAEAGSVYLVGLASVGTATDRGGVRAGCGGELIFRPHAAADLHRPFYDWNTGLVFHGEYFSVDSGRDFGAGDIILRRYLADMRRGPAGRSWFIGLGAGIGRATEPRSAPVVEGAESEGSSDSRKVRDFTFLIETGCEWSPADGCALLAKIQWRFFRCGEIDYTNALLMVGAGVPVPW